MKFQEHLTSHLTPEWRVQYIQYEKMKEILYDALEKMPSDEEADPSIKEQYFAQFEEQFFMFCDKELEKVNTFFAEKIAEAQRKFTTLKNEAECGGYLSAKSSLNQIRRGAIGGVVLDANVKKLLAKSHRKAKNLKLAFSEFYLSLVLLQNFQQLNFTGFRKILKKHDKLFETQNGLNFKKKVQKAPFFVNKGVDTLISETENIFINELEEGDRSKAMNRLRVPPLTEREKRSWVIFRGGLFFGMFLVLIVVIILGFGTKGYGDEWIPILRMYRSVFLLVMMIFLVAINTCGWRSAGVNHVLIFELNPRTHLTFQQVMEASACLSVIWCLSLLAYIYHNDIGIYPFTPPLVMAIIILAFTLNPFKCGFYGARWWLLKIVYRVITAPFHSVGFADFWLADQMNSLNTMFLDIEYSFCYLVYGWYSSGDTCSTNIYGIRPIVLCLPAWFRFAQCLRRYRDTKHVFPHLVNAGKYSTTFFIVLFSSLTAMEKDKNSSYVGAFFILWIISTFIGTCYTLTWDLKMDWGLLEWNLSENTLLREEIVYPYKFLYYFAIVEDFIFRLIWTLNVSVGYNGTVSQELMTSILAVCEIFRRFIWNFFRLENEHLNNCGEFRAVRDISVMPMDPDDHILLEAIMDDETGPPRASNSRVNAKAQKRSTIISNSSNHTSVV
ncbi:xenotropic and polytropic retrovirus receptor 1 homolog [Dendronephthya gigantea]|uniref:xenotropic and polytropic retrovirus receptor 1 homolog n=1 Tax=Dendronephthya gigantea TaxID=151771 RepID=UPI001069DFB4|nr:xenotropic and polytropic retrovirus receptor 1 homolog [Dendronephthya gigantea]